MKLELLERRLATATADAGALADRVRGMKSDLAAAGRLIDLLPRLAALFSEPTQETSLGELCLGVGVPLEETSAVRPRLRVRRLATIDAVLSLPPSVRIYLAPRATDMRKAIDGSSALVRSVLSQDALSGHLFVFCNRRRDRLKILVWDSGGFSLLMKRLEEGTFAWPCQADGGTVVLTSGELTMLLEGVDLTRLHRRKRYRLEPRESPAAAA